MSKVTLLPYWQLPDSIPSVYDVQSGSYQEMVAKVYGAMRTLQTEYNSFVDETNKIITDFINSVNKDQEEFECRMTKVIHDYLDYLDTKVKNQDKVIADAVAYMKENISQSITTIIAEMKESGELDEAVLNAIDGIGARVTTLETTVEEQTNMSSNLETRVTTLETTMEEQTNKSNNLETRVITLENTKTYLSYDETKKELNLIINEKEGE